MTMRPGPRIAMRVMRRCFQVSRGATSPCRMVPNAPLMWPTCASSRTAPRASLGLTRTVMTCLLAGPAQEAKPLIRLFLPRYGAAYWGLGFRVVGGARRNAGSDFDGPPRAFVQVLSLPFNLCLLLKSD